MATAEQRRVLLCGHSSINIFSFDFSFHAEICLVITSLNFVFQCSLALEEILSHCEWYSTCTVLCVTLFKWCWLHGASCLRVICCHYTIITVRYTCTHKHNNIYFSSTETCVIMQLIVSYWTVLHR